MASRRGTPQSNFNPRSRAGSDLTGFRNIAFSSYFNPRSRAGSDIIAQDETSAHPVFQSTLPRRERLFRFISVYFRFFISIHAPAQGATAPTFPPCLPR